MKRKVLLLLSPHENAIFQHGTFMLPPLSLGVIASVLKDNGHEVQLLDFNAVLRRWPPLQAKERLAFLYSKELYLQVLQGDCSGPEARLVEDLLSDIDVQGFDLVGISLGSDFSFLQIHLGFLIGAVLQKRHGKRVVFGGNNVTFLYLFKECFRDLWEIVLGMFPCIIKGPGETSLLSLLNGSADSAPPGCVYAENRVIRCQPECTPSITRPDFETLDLGLYGSYLEPGDDPRTLEKNLSFLYKWPWHVVQVVNSVRFRLNDGNYERKTLIPYIFNYRCPFRCAFCTESGDSGKRVIIGDVTRVADDVLYLMDRWQSEYFYFLNNAFNTSPVFADRFCEEIAARGIRFYWSDCARFNNMTEERIAAMREAGCRKLTFGFETASPAILRYIDKRIELDQAERVLEWCRKHRIWADLEVIVGLPYETDSCFQETVDFLDRNRERINSLAINEYFVVPNSLIGLHPERYRVDLVKDFVAYEDLLALNHEALLSERPTTTQNFRIYRFNETDPRREHGDIADATQRHMQAIMGLQPQEFGEVERTHQIIHQMLLAADTA
jgi:radical SAM superfamily enzyme YgiQ (UPF0313 family)